MGEYSRWYLDELLKVTSEDSIAHYGKAHDENPPGRGSGRYPYGAGNRTNQHQWDIYTRYQKLKALNPGISEAKLASLMGYYQTDEKGNIITDENGDPKGSTSALRAAKQRATNTVKSDQFKEASWYKERTDPDTGKPYSNTKIAKLMELPNESSVRSILATGENGKQNKTTEVAEKLKKASEEKGYIDIGKGTELNLGISTDGLKTSVAMLEDEGYTVKTFSVKQVSATNGQETIFKVLCPPGKDGSELKSNLTLVKTVDDPDGISSVAVRKGVAESPKVDLSRIQIKYAEDGGTDRDGMIQIRAVKDANGNLVAASPDLSLGNAKYAQVRIAVQGDRYIKGMAVYDENLPKGTDILVNSNKSRSKGVDGALKAMKVGESNPFGASVVQTEYTDPKTGKKKVSAINIVGSGEGDMHKEGAWGNWSKNLPAQFLAKQSLPLVKQQLKLQSQKTEDDLNDIRKINNPVVKRKMLIDFADQTDAAAVDLKAAPIGGQKTHVLLPVKSLKDNEIYAPNFDNGTTVALVRFPHAGPFEIPVLKVNNNNKEAKSFMKNAKDAVGINQTVAQKLSGADFDGDTAIVIPMTRKNSEGGFDKVTNIKSAGSLPGLAGFDPTAEYGVDNPRFSKMVNSKGEPTYKYFKTEKDKGREMGVVSNLITDMYAKGCDDPAELADAVRYSMVVIDAKKHKLNYKAAEQDYHIKDLKKKYQDNGIDPKTGKEKYGVSSLLSRSKSPVKVDSRAIWSGYRSGEIDPETGAKIYSAPKRNANKQEGYWERVTAPKGYTWTDSNGKVHKGATYMKDPATGKDLIATTDGKVVKNKDGSYSYDRGSGKDKWVQTGWTRRQQDSTRMAEATDARTLLSAHPSEIEQAYATYANHMKALANQARKESLSVPSQKYDPSAKKQYAKEVKELDEALIKAKKNAPRERQAQLLATSRINAILDEHPEYEADDRRKVRGQELNIARSQTGAKKDRITFTEKQWEAINAGAVSESKLQQLLSNADKDSYMSLALPKKDRISDSKKTTAKSLASAGWTQEQIAEFLDISTSSVSNILS